MTIRQESPASRRRRAAAGVEAIAAELRERIATGRLALGERLSDQAIALELRVSRTPVREALLALRAEGLVTARPQSGTFVFRPDGGEIADICDLRTVYEAGAVELAWRRDGVALLRALRAVIGEAAAALSRGDLAACEDCDTTFHETLVAQSGNPLLIAAYRGISGRVRALRHHLPQSTARYRAALAQHRRIVAHLAGGRIPAVRAELTDHLHRVRSLLEAPEGASLTIHRRAGAQSR